MNPSSVHIVARFIAKPDTIKQLQTVLEALPVPTRQEAGCRRYLLLQNQQNPADFTFVEEWADEAAFNQHVQSTHLKQAVAEMNGLLAIEPDIQRYTLVG
ncbi:MAG: putative quinol monooxygenase [Candidatus Competibacter denitrificans]